MNKALLPLTEEDQNLVDAAPASFRSAFAQESKELVDQVKAMRSHLPGHKEGKQFFQNVPPNSRGEPVRPKAKTRRKSEQPRILKGRDPSGINEHRSTHCLKFFDNRFQKYANEPFSMSGYNSPQTIKLSPSREVGSFPTNWSKVTQDRWVLNTILGYPIDFSLIPHQPVIPHCSQYSAEQSRLISE